MLWKLLFGLVGFITAWVGLVLIAKGYAIPAVASWAVAYFGYSIVVGGNDEYC